MKNFSAAILVFASFFSLYLGPAHGCSFGPLDGIKIDFTKNDILSAIYHACGGEVTIRRVFEAEEADATELKRDEQFQLSAKAGRFSDDKCILLRNGRVNSIYQEDGGKPWPQNLLVD